MKAGFQANVAPMAAGAEVGSWGYGVSVYGAAWGHRREVVTPSLMADMYGFVSEEEMQDTKAYHSVPWWLPTGTGKRVSVIGVNCMTLG